MNEFGFIGDIHGCVEELEEVVRQASERASRLVFLGDYLNRGRKSREVIEFLVNLEGSKHTLPCTFLRGHHDEAFLRTLDQGEFDSFLRMGGAATVASYVPAPKGDVLTQLRTAVPVSHLEFLRGLETNMTHGNSLFASHDRPAKSDIDISPYGFCVYGHSPQLSLMPTIRDTEAFVDTGCGTIPGGRLTCLFWPTLEWIQSKPVR